MSYGNHPGIRPGQPRPRVLELATPAQSTSSLAQQARELLALVEAGAYDSDPAAKARARAAITAAQQATQGTPRRPAASVHDPWPTPTAQPTAPAPIFGTGDGEVPAFTASGVDPSMLRGTPPNVRRALAAEPDAGRVYRVVDYLARQKAGLPVTSDGLQPGDLKLLTAGWVE